MADAPRGPRFGIRARSIALLMVVSVVGVGFAGSRILGEQMDAIRRGVFEQATRTAEILGRSVTPMLLREQPSALRDLAEEVLLSQSEDPVAPLVYVSVADARGRSLFRSDETYGAVPLAPEEDDVLTFNVLVSREPVREIVRRPDGHLVLDVGVPCSVRGVDDRSRVYGVVRVGVGLDGLEERWDRAVSTATLSLALAIVLAILVGFLATGGVIRAVRRMTEAVSDIAAGDFGRRILSYRGDELGTLARSIDRMAEDLQKRELLKRYISASAWEEIEEKGLLEAEEDEVALKEVTVLFLDIRNYTSLAEDYESREVVGLLNEVFTVLIDVVDEFGGVIDKFIGDALLVVFYPGHETDDAVRAVFAGARMQEALQDFNQRRQFYGREAISIGVGINTGTVIAGSVGAVHRRDYTVIGDPVNVAARLQERSKEGGHTRVVLSQSTYDEVSSLVEVEALAGTAVRGRKEDIPAYEVVTLKGLKGILDDLEHEDPKVRQEAFQALEATGGPVAVPHLMRLLGSDRQAAVLKAIPILARLGGEDETVVRLLGSMIHTTEDTRVLATAIRSLGHLGGFDDLGALRDFLVHDDPRVRANTIEALDALGGEGCVELIEPLLHDPHQRVKANAAVVLFKRGRREVVEELVDLSRDGSPAERAAATFAMGELFASEFPGGAAGSVEVGVKRILEDLESFGAMARALVERLDDEDAGVIHRAVVAVAKARETSALERLAVMAREGAREDRELALHALSRIGVPPRVARVLRELRRLEAEED